MQRTTEIHEAQGHEAAVMPMWLSYRDAETYSGLSRVTLWRLRREGAIQAAQVGRAVRFNRESLDAYMQSRSENA